MKKDFTITAYTENHIGLLNRITIIFTRRHVNIETLTVSESEVKGISRFTISVIEPEEMVKKITNQIQKLVEVIRASYYDDVIMQEIALYKIKTEAFINGNEVEQLIRQHNARILRIEQQYVVIEKTGHKAETQALFEQLEPYGVIQFVRSGRVALTKGTKKLTTYIKELDKMNGDL